VFADGWTVDAAASVSDEGEEETLDLLDALTGHSLVSVDAGESAPRFRMLTAVRELAAERLAETPDWFSVGQRHAAYFAALVEDADAQAEGQTAWADHLLTDEQNLRAAIRWFFTHDITRLPHIFRVLWLFWQMNDRMPEGRAWIDELRTRLHELDERPSAEVLFTWAVTACAVGDDDSALDALRSIEQVRQTLDDPSVVNGLHVAMAWTLPIIDDLDGALRAALMALEGYRHDNEPFMALAALTVGLLEMSQGQDDDARPLLLDVKQMGDCFNNSWLTSTARTQLATIAVRAGRLDEAHDLLVEAVESIEGTNVSTLTATFALVAYAQLALAAGDARQAAIALGAVDGLRRRAGLLAWPVTRPGELELAERLAEQADSAVLAAAHETGSALDRRDALALVRNGDWAA
jgi:hypothetical protein